jgi:hypothetical protein
MSLLLASLLACSILGGPTPPEGDTDTDADADTDADTDADGDTDQTHEDTGPYLEPGEPSFVAGFDSHEFEAAKGHWLVVGSETWLTGDSNNQEVTLSVVVTGDLRERGRFPVETVHYRDSIDEDDWDFQYSGNGGADFVVDGHDEELDLLWGHLEGSVALTDAEGGPNISLDSLVLASWE